MVYFPCIVLCSFPAWEPASSEEIWHFPGHAPSHQMSCHFVLLADAPEPFEQGFERSEGYGWVSSLALGN